MQGQVRPVKFADFEEIVDGNDIVLLDFWAGWCGPCKIFSPIYEQAAAAYPEVYFGKVDTEAEQELSQAFQVRSIPTLMAFKKSELVFEQSGIIPPPALHALIEKLREA